MFETPTAAEPETGPLAVDNAEPAGDTVSSRVVAGFRAYGLIIAALIILVVLAGIFVQNFLTVQNMFNVLQQMSIVGVVALGMTFVILTGGIDLSVGSVLALSGIIFALLVNGHMAPLLALVLAIAAGGAVGLINGLLVTALGVQPFVVTLAALAIAQGLALSLSHGNELMFTQTSGVLNFIGNGGIGQLSGQFVVFVGLALVAWLTLRYVPFGRYVYAVGGSPETARLSGIRTKRILAAVYIISGAGAGLAGVMTAMQLSVGVPTAGSLTNLDAIAAVVIGGTSLMGGRGSLWGSVAGAFVLAVVADVLTLLGVSPYDAQIVRGFVILAAVLLGALGVLSIGGKTSAGARPRRRGRWSRGQ